MKKFTNTPVTNRIHPFLWIVIVVCFIAPLGVDDSNGREWIWFLSIVPAFPLSYFYGMRGGVWSALLQLLIHGGWVSVQIIHKGEIFENDNLPTIIATFMVSFLIAIYVGYLVDRLQRNQRKFKESEERFRQIVELSPEMIVIYRQGKIEYVNPSGVKLLGASKLDQLIGKSVLDFVHPDYHNQVKKRIQWINEESSTIDRIEEILVGMDGRNVVVESIGTPIIYEGKHDVLGLLRDITERKQLEQRLKLYAEVIEHTLQGVTICDADANILFVNNAFTKITGYSLDEVLGRNPRILQSGVHDGKFYENLWNSIITTGQWQGEIWNKNKSGKVYPEILNISAIKNKAGKIVNYVAVFNNITEMKKVQQQLKEANDQLQKLSHLDGLTGIANRRSFDEYLNQEWGRAARQGTSLSLAMLDIDFFKGLNDTYGHQYGDDCLKQVAQVLNNSLERSSDFAARFGGEEFAIILPATDIEGAVFVAEGLRRNVESLKLLYEGSLISQYVTVSVGVATMIPDITHSPEHLLANADHALYRAKQNGRNRLEIYQKCDNDMDHASS